MKKYTLSTLFIFIIACGLRWYHLTTDSLWLDELISIWFAKLSFNQFWQVMLHENHPPLYYIMLCGWIKLLGDSAFAVRSLSVICGIAIIPVLFVTLRRLYNIQTAYYVSALTAVLPPLIRYSQEARMYAPVALFATIALSGALLYLQKPCRKYGLLFVLGMTLALYTHYFAVFLWIMLLIFVGAEMSILRGSPFVKKWCLLCTLPLLAFSPWIGVIISQYKENAATHWIAQMPSPGVDQLIGFPQYCLGFFDQRWGMQVGCFGLSTSLTFVLLLVAAGMIFPLAHQTYQAHQENNIISTTTAEPYVTISTEQKNSRVILPGLISIVTILVIWLLCQVKNAWLPKYIIVAVPGIAISVSALLFQKSVLLFRGKRIPEKLVITGKLLVAWLLLGNALCATAQTVGTMLPYSQEDWQGTTQEIQRQITPKTEILVENSMLRVCLTYYGIPEDQIVTLGNHSLFGGMPSDIARQKLEQANTVIAVVWTGRRGDIDEYLSKSGIGKLKRTDIFTGISLETFQRKQNEK
jgi:uncharacterized membrane protein